MTRKLTLNPEVKRLDEMGRCCGRKPLVYKRPTLHLFCCRCNAEYSSAGEQIANWAFTRQGDGFVSSELCVGAAAFAARHEEESK